MKENKVWEKMKRRQFLEQVGKTAAKITGITAGAGSLYEIAKKTSREIIENAPEGIYYLLTGKKIQLKAITEGNYKEILDSLRKQLSEELKIKVDLRIFVDLDEGIKELAKKKNKTIIIVTWSTKEGYSKREPSLGFILDIKENYINVWDPNHGEIVYENTLGIWRKNKKPLVCLIIDKKIELDSDRLEEIRRSIKELNERQ